MNKYILNHYVFFFLLLINVTTIFTSQADPAAEKHIVVVIASYNNERWYQWNLDSVFSQKYNNYSVIYIDDCSSDKTGQLVESYLEIHDTHKRCTLIKNEYREGCPIANHYKAIHTCDPKSIIVILDGDDRFAHDQVLARVNQLYADGTTWITYGQYKEYPSGHIGFCRAIPLWVMQKNTFREYEYVQSHLRTFYAGLFQKIKKEDLMDGDAFLSMSGDIAAMFPMCEMAREGHITFVEEVLLDYNAVNPLSEHRISQQLQFEVARKVRQKPKYQPLSSPF